MKRNQNLKCTVCEKKKSKEDFSYNNREENSICKDCHKEIVKTEINYDNENKGWSLSKEREFYENLFVARFNVFIIVFSLFVTAGFSNQLSPKCLIFFGGAFVLFLFWLPLLKLLSKFNLIMTLLMDEKNHTLHKITKLNKELRENNGKWIIEKWIIGKWDGKRTNSNWQARWIPLICILFLFFIGIFVLLKFDLIKKQ